MGDAVDKNMKLGTAKSLAETPVNRTLQDSERNGLHDGAKFQNKFNNEISIFRFFKLFTSPNASTNDSVGNKKLENSYEVFDLHEESPKSKVKYEEIKNETTITSMETSKINIFTIKDGRPNISTPLTKSNDSDLINFSMKEKNQTYNITKLNETESIVEDLQKVGPKMQTEKKGLQKDFEKINAEMAGPSNIKNKTKDYGFFDSKKNGKNFIFTENQQTNIIIEENSGLQHEGDDEASGEPVDDEVYHFNFSVYHDKVMGSGLEYNLHDEDTYNDDDSEMFYDQLESMSQKVKVGEDHSENEIRVKRSIHSHSNHIAQMPGAHENNVKENEKHESLKVEAAFEAEKLNFVSSAPEYLEGTIVKNNKNWFYSDLPGEDEFTADEEIIEEVLGKQEVRSGDSVSTDHPTRSSSRSSKTNQGNGYEGYANKMKHKNNVPRMSAGHKKTLFPKKNLYKNVVEIGVDKYPSENEKEKSSSLGDFKINSNGSGKMLSVIPWYQNTSTNFPHRNFVNKELIFSNSTTPQDDDYSYLFSSFVNYNNIEASKDPSDSALVLPSGKENETQKEKLQKNVFVDGKKKQVNQSLVGYIDTRTNATTSNTVQENDASNNEEVIGKNMEEENNLKSNKSNTSVEKNIYEEKKFENEKKKKKKEEKRKKKKGKNKNKVKKSKEKNNLDLKSNLASELNTEDGAHEEQSWFSKLNINESNVINFTFKNRLLNIGLI